MIDIAPCCISTPSVPSIWNTAVPFSVASILPLAASTIFIADESVPEFVFRVRSPVPLEVIVAAALESPTTTVSATKATSPVPFGVNVILLFAPSVITIVPELVPLFVLSVKSSVPPVVTVNAPAPFEVRVAAAPESPTLTVSPARTTSPVPFGVRLMSAFDVVTILFPFKSRSPPSWGVESPATDARPPTELKMLSTVTFLSSPASTSARSRTSVPLVTSPDDIAVLSVNIAVAVVFVKLASYAFGNTIDVFA